MSESSERKTYFTKHLFRAGIQCPTKLYYYAHHYPQDDRIRPFIEHAGYNKHQLKILVRSRFPQGIYINETSREAAARETNSQLKASEAVLFDAVFIDRRRVAKVPLVVKEGQDVRLYFLQSKVINPNKHRLTNHHGQLHKKWKQYIYDAAYQLYVAQQCYPQLNFSCHLLLPNKKAAANEDKLNRIIQQPGAQFDEELLYEVDITGYVYDILENRVNSLLPDERSFSETLDKLTTDYFSGDWQPVEIGLKCRDCEFRIAQEQVEKGQQSGFVNCWKTTDAAPEFSASAAHVFDLIGPGVSGWIEQGIYLQKNIPPAELPALKSIADSQNAFTHKQRQALQVMQAQGKAVPEEIVKGPIMEELDRWEYPLHFLDFEAGNYAVPIRKDRSPYQLVLFQFSCHTMHRDGTLSHSEWVAEGQNPYPNYELVRQLKQVSDLQKGTIIQYSNFERSALKKIRTELQNEMDQINDARQLIEWLETIIRRNDSNNSSGPHLADLSRLVKRYYYNRNMADSLSIKDVVQSVLTVSDALKAGYQKPCRGSNFERMQWWQWDEKKEEAKNPYQLLRSLQSGVKVGRGTEAMVTFGKILSDSLRDEHKKQALKALLKYCELDTLAMVMIVQHWQSLGRTN